jgi:hypothetical protein
MKKRMNFNVVGLLLVSLMFWSCYTTPTAREERHPQNDVMTIKTYENDELNVRLIKGDQAERDKILISAFLRCADIAVSYVRYWPGKHREYNYLDESYFRRQEPIFLIDKRHIKTHYEYKRVREYDPYGGGYDIYKRIPIRHSHYREGFMPKSEFKVTNADESHGRVSYEEVVRNYFTAEYYGEPYTPNINNNIAATKYIYEIFRKLYQVDDFTNSDFDINPSFGFGTIWGQNNKGSISYIPLDEIYDANPSYKDYKPNIDLTEFDNYFKKLKWDEKTPIVHFYLYRKYNEVDLDSQYRTMH